MKSKFIGIVLLITSGLAEDFTLLPFDLSGQYGIGTADGYSLWHQDWQWGALVFDGSVQPNPFRLHPDINWLRSTKQVIQSASSDSAGQKRLMTSAFNYQRGDYNLSTLGVELNFPETKRDLSLVAYKRSYPGGRGEFIHPDGQGAPIQQTYYLDYLSHPDDKRNLEISIGHFITHSGLPTDLYNARHNQYDTQAGMNYSFESEYLFWKAEIASGLHRRKVQSSTDSLDFSRKVVNNQAEFRMGLITENKARFYCVTEVESRAKGNAQATSSAFFGGYKRGILMAEIGMSEAAGTIYPFFASGISARRPKFNLQAGLSHRTHLLPASMLAEKGNVPVEWSVLSANYERFSKYFNFELSTDYRRAARYYEWYANSDTSALQLRAAEAGYFCFNTQVKMKINPNWSMTGEYSHVATSSPTLSKGIGDAFQIMMEGRIKFLFRGALDLYARLDVQGWLNRDEQFGYDPYYELPYVKTGNNVHLQNVFPIGFELHADVSSVTITYRVDNLGYLGGRIFNKSTASDGTGLWDINTNTYFYDLGKIVWFSVEWHFNE